MVKDFAKRETQEVSRELFHFLVARFAKIEVVKG